MKRFVIIFSLLLIANLSNAWADPSLCSRVESILRSGDVIFSAGGSSAFRQVGEINDSWVSHVGLAFQDGYGKWIVSESTFPKSIEIDLCEFLKRTEKNQIAVRRVNGRSISDPEIRALHLAASQRLGIGYDLGFEYFNSKTQFCSKFVYQIYKEALGIEVGTMQTFKQLFDGATDRDEKVKFWKLWFGGNIPWERITVTPYSEYINQNLETVLDTTKE